MDIVTWKLNAAQILGLACAGVVIGIGLKKLMPVLDRLNIPASVVGGLFYAVLILGLRDRYLNLEMDLVLRDILMVAFFTTIGMSASLRVVRRGGKQVLIFWLLATIGVLLENVLGVGLAKLLGLDPLIGLLAGSTTMAGGPATALAFGGTFEKLGVPAGTTLGIAAAIFGIIAGGLLGGFVGGHLIRKHNLKSASADPAALNGAQEVEAMVYAGDPPDEEATRLDQAAEAERSSMLHNVIAVGIAMGIGTLISMGLERMGLLLPSYIGAMLVAGVLRNIDDKLPGTRISQQQMDEIGMVSLDLFIVMALLTLRLWELVNLAMPVLVLLAAQVVLVLLLSSLMVFRFMGRDHDAAVMAGGYCGFMLGTTANAMACMNEIVRVYGRAARAFLVVSIVGAFLIDFTNALIITEFINLFR